VPIHHLQLWVPDLARAEASWGWLLESLGFEPARRWETGCVWRQDGTGIVIEQSPDMVPGMLYSRLRPGLNHVAFHVESAARITAIIDGASDHGWTTFGTDTDPRHPMPGEVAAAYLEDRDGFEVELIAPAS
jgi:catechol 2,3-dioxygenase-like lactoylglutathione lyase family enzyme